MSGAVFRLQHVDDALTVSGEIDVTNADAFAHSVTELSDERPVILELSRLDYLDSAGFAAVDGLLARGAILVVSPESLIHKAAELMELPFHHDVETARRVAAGA